MLATKVGKRHGRRTTRACRKAYIRRAVEASLRRLQTDRIDLYQSHEDDPTTPLEETLGAFAELIREGKVRAIGASNFTAPTRLALALDDQRAPRPAALRVAAAALQPRRARAYEDALEPLCVERGIGVINFYALASGFLTGKYRSSADSARACAAAARAST